jgi:hypothetical protein
MGVCKVGSIEDLAAAEIYAALNQKLAGYIPKVLLAETAKG